MSGSSTAASVLPTDGIGRPNAAGNAFTVGANAATSSDGSDRAVKRVVLLREKDFAHERIAEPLHLVVRPRVDGPVVLLPSLLQAPNAASTAASADPTIRRTAPRRRVMMSHRIMSS